jgi:HEAT repeat protein
MHPIARRLALLLVAVAGLLVAYAQGVSPAHANEDIDRDCICETSGGACQHFLRNPKTPTDDPCWCHKCRTFSKHDGTTVPDGMNPLCFTSSRMECYLKRHAATWGITCSVCVQNDDCCKFPEHQNCPDCQDGDDNPLGRDAFGRPAKETVLQRLEREQRFFKKPKKVIVAYNRNFYLVTDVGPMKVKQEGGGSYRMADPHEWAHLMLERAEYARREFIQHIGTPRISKPTAIFIPAKERDAGKIQGAYLGSPRTNILYGGSDSGSMADGFCFNGFCQSEQKFSGDHDQHMAMRHSLGHIFISCWQVVDGNNRALPRWMFVGAAHWLCKLQERFRDDVTFCGNESTPLTGSGKKWYEDCAKLARTNKFTPIEELFGKTAGGQLTLEDHKRAWAYFHIMLEEWREPFVKVLGDLRLQKEPRDAFMQHVNCTPEVFHDRIEERLTGKRRSMDPTKSEEDFEGNENPGVRERKKLLAESDPQKLAALIRGLGTITDARTAETVIDLFKKNSELVRETAVVTLLKIDDQEVLEAVWQYGLNHKNAMSRAYTARVCGRKELEFSLIKLREQLEDSNWYARAEAAVACGLMKDIRAMRGLRNMVNDPAEKARVAAMDALAMFGEEAEMAVPLITKHLTSPQWQLRVTACQALGKIGSMEAVEPLITRMEIESGRVRGDIKDALKEITRDDLGRKPENWRKWWEREKANSPSGLPKRPDEPSETGPVAEQKPDANDRYAQQEYYGIEIYSSRIGFVLDTSGSMASNFVPNASQARALKLEVEGQTNKINICKEQIARTLKSLDPRSHFNVISFNTTVRTMSKNPISASPGNVKKAFGFLRSLPATGETNYYGALRAALDLGQTLDASPNFRSTPDTLTFLTDGMPTRGEMTDADTLLEWYTALNRYTRVRTHVICFGSKGVDLVLLRGMAERNDGRFVHVAEAR